MEEILVFQHDSFEDLVYSLGVWNVKPRIIGSNRLFDGETPTKDWQRIKGLIVLGGPMSVQDELNHPFIRWEKRIIHAAINDGVTLLGFCLGAPLIASTLGTAVYQGPVKEIG